MTTDRSLDNALQAAASTPRLLVASDFDGTLAEIVSRPELAVANPGAVSALVGLAVLPATDAAVVSGRSREELTKLVGDPSEVILVGSHGAEWDEPLELSDDQITALAAARALVEEVAAAHPGSMVEPKQAAVVLHTRGIGNPMAADRAASAVRDAANHIHGVVVLDGKKVVELAVTPQTKGSALARLRRRLAATAVVFLGDDRTDETGFEVLEPTDIGVKVGPGATFAGYRVGTVDDVAGLLDRLLELRRSQ
jgi:trehalose 6-phosphate phosphatase